MNRKLLKEVLLPLRIEGVLRRLGYGTYRPAPPEIKNRVRGAITEARGYLEPAVVYADAAVLDGPKPVLIEGGLELPGEDIAKRLSGATRVTVFAGTVGREIEAESSRRSGEGRPDEALYLDAAGSEAAEELARTSQRWAHHRAAREGMRTAGRFSPGYGDLPLSIQRELLDYLGAAEIGMAAGENFMLRPEKSVTGIIGWISKR